MRHIKKLTILFVPLLLLFLLITLFALKNTRTSLKSKAAYPDEPPQNVFITNPTSASFNVVWLTKKPTRGKVYYTTKTNYEQTKKADLVSSDELQTPSTVHSVSLSGLTQNTPYAFFICSGDDCSNNKLYGQGIKEVLGDQTQSSTNSSDLIDSKEITLPTNPQIDISILPTITMRLIPSPTPFAITVTPTPFLTLIDEPEETAKPTKVLISSTISPSPTSIPSPVSSNTPSQTTSSVGLPISQGSGVPIIFTTSNSSNFSSNPSPLFGRLVIPQSKPDYLLMLAIIKKGASTSYPLSIIIRPSDSENTFVMELTNARNSTDGSFYTITNDDLMKVVIYWTADNQLKEKEVLYPLTDVSPISEKITL